MNTCPKCAAAIDESADQCPACGIFFSKWREREDNIASGNISKYSAIANATSSEFNWTILVIVALVVAGIFFFMFQHVKDLNL